MVPDRPELNRPTIRHPDLAPRNIFVSSGGRITGLLDWQYTVVQPLFIQAKVPDHFQNYGDDESDRLQTPRLPEGFDDMDDEEKESERDLYGRRLLHYIYFGSTSIQNKPHFHAMTSHDCVL